MMIALQTVANGDTLVYAVFGAGTLLMVLWIGRGVRDIYQSRSLRAEEPDPISAVDSADEHVELKGTARVLDETVTSADGVECLAYKSVPSGGESTQPNESERVPFVLEDDAEAVAVDPTDANLALFSEAEHEDRLEPDDIVHVLGSVASDEADTTGTDWDLRGTVSAEQVTDGGEAYEAKRIYDDGVEAVVVGLIGLLFLAFLFTSGYL